MCYRTCISCTFRYMYPFAVFDTLACNPQNMAGLYHSKLCALVIQMLIEMRIQMNYSKLVS